MVSFKPHIVIYVVDNFFNAQFCSHKEVYDVYTSDRSSVKFDRKFDTYEEAFDYFSSKDFRKLFEKLEEIGV